MIGELLATLTPDRAILERIGGGVGEAARDAATELAALPPARARTWRAGIMAALRAPTPPGIRGAHASWIEAGITGLPARARASVSETRDATDVWLARWACSNIPPLPAIASERSVEIGPLEGSPRSIDEAVRLSGDALVAWLADVGADQLAYALSSQGAALPSIAKIAGDRLLVAARRITESPRVGALGPHRDAIKRCRCSATGTELLLRIGARAIAPHTDPLSRAQLAARLPHALGSVLRDEMAAHGRVPLDRVPTWSALGA